MNHGTLVSGSLSYVHACRGSSSPTAGALHLVHRVLPHTSIVRVQAVLNSGLNEKTDAELINMIGQIIGNLQAEKMVTRAN